MSDEIILSNEVIRFVIPGAPVGKGRPRFVRQTGRTYTPEKTVNYENLVKLMYNEQTNRHYFDRNCELAMRIDARFAIPKSASKRARHEMELGIKRPTSRPDADNLIKSIADSLNGLAYHDDSQIVYVEATKHYGDPPQTIVTLWAL